MSNVLAGFALGFGVGIALYIYEYIISDSLSKYIHEYIHRGIDVFVYTSVVTVMLMTSDAYFSSYLYSLAGLISAVLVTYFLIIWI